MICPSCRYDNPEAAQFCGGCGQPLSVTVACPGCGTKNPGGQKFCNGCGRRLTVAPPSPAATRNPGSYTPKHLAEKILRSKSALEGEHKQVTVLFADVQGSLSLSEALDPEVLHRIMDRFFGILTEGVHRFEGTVNQYTGDGIMALFGAPIAHEDHAQRACYAALHLTSELRRYADELRLSMGLNFAVRMGLNSGEVVVGKIGDDLRMDYTAQGPTVGLAARMEKIAEPGKVYLTDRTARLVEGFFQLRDLGRARVKGIKEPFGIFELEGIGPIRTRLEVSRSRGFSRFVGRADEMAALEFALECATACNAQVVGVVGEAGVGKSRLCLEVTERYRAKGTLICEAHCPAHGKTVPFLPLLQLLRSFFGISERDGNQKVRETIAGRLVLLDREFEEDLPLVFEFLGVPDPDRPAPRIDRGARQRRLTGFARRLVQATGVREPTILFVDDLHWIDPGSDAFLAHIAEAVIGTRTTLLVNFRPEYRADWMTSQHYQQLDLLPLSPQAVEELLRHLLGQDSSVAGLHDLICERTRGNPFFVEELVKSLVESGSLAGEPGGYRLTKPIEALEIPGTVKSLLAARIDRLSETEKQVLQTAAVMGKKFSESVLRRVVELPDDDLAASLSTLQGAGLVYEEALYPTVEYAFKHPLTQEVAYQSQLSERRTRIHAAVARAIEAVSSARLDENAALLAHHWEEAGNLTEAARWHRRAAEWAGINSAEALRHWGKVRDLLDAIPKQRETLSHGAAARAQILWHQLRMGITEEQAAALFKEGHDLATRSENRPALALILNSYGLFRLYSGAVHEALEFAAAAVREADRAGDPGLRIAVRWTLVAVHFSAGRVDECVRVIDESLPLAEHDFDLGSDIQGYSPYLFMLALRGYAWAAKAQLDQAARDLDRALDLSRAHGNAFNMASAHRLYVSLCEITGDYIGALAHGHSAAELTAEKGNPVTTIWSSQALGNAYALNGRWSDAVGILEPALALARKYRTFLQMEPEFLATLAWVFLESGHREKARARAEEAVRLADRYGTKLFEVRAHLTLSRVLRGMSEQSSAKRIDSALARAQALIEETGAVAYLPWVREERAGLARLLGNEEKRSHELREAHRLFTEMGATRHAERLAGDLGVPKV